MIRFPRMLWSALMLGWLLGGQAMAHDARPAVVEIIEQAPDVFYASIRIPPVLSQSSMPVLVWPEACESMGGSVVRCPGGLEGALFSLDYPIVNPSLSTYFSFAAADGSQTSMILGPSETSWEMPESRGRGSIALNYLILGFEHILIGLDHLLFVLGLVVISRTPKRILLTVTGFTLAHSVTLFLSTLGLINIPILPVEAVIALSILFLAYEISMHEQASLTYRYPVLVSSVFGLLHGLGFASALGEVGLAPNEIFLSLLFFNVGVELGQLAFIAAVVLVYFVIREVLRRVPMIEVDMKGEVAARRADLLVSYAIGIPSAYWVIERSAGFLF